MRQWNSLGGWTCRNAITFAPFTLTGVVVETIAHVLFPVGIQCLEEHLAYRRPSVSMLNKYVDKGLERQSVKLNKKIYDYYQKRHSKVLRCISGFGFPSLLWHLSLLSPLKARCSCILALYLFSYLASGFLAASTKNKPWTI